MDLPLWIIFCNIALDLIRLGALKFSGNLLFFYINSGERLRLTFVYEDE